MRFLIFLLAAVYATAQTAKAPPPRVSPAEVIKRVEPEYSPEARAANYEGTLTVYVEIEPSGKPANVQVIQGLGLGLDEKAVEAVKRWEFKPAELSGKPLQTAQGIEIRFRRDPVGGWRVRHTHYAVTRNSENDRILEKPIVTRYTRPDPAVCADLGGSLVAVHFSLDKKGVPHEIQVGPQPTAAMARAIFDAAQTWRFHPARSQGKPADAAATFTLECGPDPPPGAEPAYKIGPGTIAPKPTFQPEPEYSEAARKKKWTGSVRLAVVVDTDGFATDLRTVRFLGYGLDAKAMEAVKQWRFQPGLKDGKPVAAEALIDVTFHLL